MDSSTALRTLTPASSDGVHMNEDMRALARSVAAKMAEKKREEAAPFRTKALRRVLLLRFWSSFVDF